MLLHQAATRCHVSKPFTISELLLHTTRTRLVLHEKWDTPVSILRGVLRQGASRQQIWSARRWRPLASKGSRSSTHSCLAPQASAMGHCNPLRQHVCHWRRCLDQRLPRPLYIRLAFEPSSCRDGSDEPIKSTCLRSRTSLWHRSQCDGLVSLWHT
jgi:hypothetical protein